MVEPELSKSVSLSDQWSRTACKASSIGRIIHSTPKLNLHPDEPNIFQAKTPREMTRVYNKLLVTVGKWNADMFLKIHKGIKEQNTKIPKVCPEASETIRNRKCIFGKSDKLQAFNSPTVYNQINKECKSKVLIETYPHEESDPEREPSYRKIFKNARNSRKSSPDRGFWLNRPTSTVHESPSDSPSTSMKQEPASLARPCELMPNADNNYLLQMRERRKSSKNKHSRDISVVYHEQDDIAALFQEIPIKNVMQEHLSDQVDFTKASIGERLIKVDPEDEWKGLSYLKTAMLGNERMLDAFQDKINDARWRRKFNLEKMELSDEADTTDGSEIDVSDSSSLCSGDSLGTSIDGKVRKPKRSRVPYIDEVRRKRDDLYKKISMKWEKVVRKNLIEPNLRLTPIFRDLYTTVRFRSHHQFYSRILQSLNSKFEAMYPKKFVAYKHRLRRWIRKDLEQQALADQILSERTRFESTSTTRKPPHNEPKLIDYTPTKYLTNNQRIRLKRIMNDVETKEDEGFEDWSKKLFVEDYVNLRPIISTKGEPKIVRHYNPQEIRYMSSATSCKKGAFDRFRQPLVVESSLYFKSLSKPEYPKGLCYVRFDMNHKSQVF